MWEVKIAAFSNTGFHVLIPGHFKIRQLLFTFIIKEATFFKKTNASEVDVSEMVKDKSEKF